MFAMQGYQRWIWGLRGGGNKTKKFLYLCVITPTLVSCPASYNESAALPLSHKQQTFFSHEEDRQRSGDRDIPLPESPPCRLALTPIELLKVNMYLWALLKILAEHRLIRIESIKWRKVYNSRIISIHVWLNLHITTIGWVWCCKLHIQVVQMEMDCLCCHLEFCTSHIRSEQSECPPQEMNFSTSPHMMDVELWSSSLAKRASPFLHFAGVRCKKILPKRCCLSYRRSGRRAAGLIDRGS